MARDFFVRQGDLTPRYFVYCKENQRGMAEKDRHLGMLTCFKQGLMLDRDEKEAGSPRPLFSRGAGPSPRYDGMTSLYAPLPAE